MTERTPNTYFVGDADVSVTYLPGNKLDISVSRARSTTTADGEYKITSPEAETAANFLKTLILSAFNVSISMDMDAPEEGQASRFTVTPALASQAGALLRPVRSMAETAPEHSQMELKPASERQRDSLDHEIFTDFMQAVAAKFPDKKSVDTAIQKHAEHKARQAALVAASKREHTEAKVDRGQKKPKLAEAQALLKPAIITLAKHGIILEEETLPLIYSLINGIPTEGSSSPQTEKKDALRRNTESYANAVMNFVVQFAPETTNDEQLLEDLKIAFGKALTEGRGAA